MLKVFQVLDRMCRASSTSLIKILDLFEIMKDKISQDFCSELLRKNRAHFQESYSHLPEEDQRMIDQVINNMIIGKYDLKNRIQENLRKFDEYYRLHDQAEPFPEDLYLIQSHEQSDRPIQTANQLKKQHVNSKRKRIRKPQQKVKNVPQKRPEANKLQEESGDLIYDNNESSQNIFNDRQESHSQDGNFKIV